MLNFAQILNKTEAVELTQEYKVNEHEGIGGKPHISAGGEVLRRYSLPIKLHASFCNPQEIIDEIEVLASERTTINYFLLGKYIGDFVIERFQQKIIQTIGNAVFYAEITIDIVENPDSITEFEEQDEGENISAETISEDESIMKNFLEESKNLIKESSISAAMDVVNNANLPSVLGQVTFNNLARTVINSLKNIGLNGIYELIEDNVNNLLGGELSANEIELLKRELIKIPDAVVDTALRI